MEINIKTGVIRHLGFKIVIDEYSDGKWFWSIKKNGELVASTLWNDDKMWKEDNCLQAAIRDLDEWVSSGYKKGGYFLKDYNENISLQPTPEPGKDS